VLHCTGENEELQSGVLTEKLGTSLMKDLERLKLGSVCNLLLFILFSVLCRHWKLENRPNQFRGQMVY